MRIARWVEGAPHHRGALQRFTCTTAPVRRGRTVLHDEPWAFEVQSLIRGRQSVPCPARRPKRLVLALDESDEILAVVHYEELGDEIFLALVAVALRCRGAGGQVADEAMNFFVRNVMEFGVERGLEAVTVTANVHPGNQASKKMLHRHGWRPAGTLFESGEYEVWELAVVAEA